MSKVTTEHVFAAADQIRARGYLVGQAYNPFKPHHLVLPKPARDSFENLPKITDVEEARIRQWIEFYGFKTAEENQLCLQAVRREKSSKAGAALSGVATIVLAIQAGHDATKSEPADIDFSVGLSCVFAMISASFYILAHRAFRAQTSHTTQRFIDQGNVSALETIQEQVKRAEATAPDVQLPG